MSIFFPNNEMGTYQEFTLHVHSNEAAQEIFAWKQYVVHSPNIERKAWNDDNVSFTSIAELPIAWQKVIRIAEYKYWMNIASFSFMSMMGAICISALCRKDVHIISAYFFWLAIAFLCSVVIWVYASTPARVIVKSEKRAVSD